MSEDIETDDIIAVMRTTSGRRFVWGILVDDCRVDASTFHCDSRQSAYNEGRRQTGLSLIDKLKTHARDEYVRMVKENL